MGSFVPLESYFKKQGFLYVAGVDEAGRGPLAGPVVSAAVILKKGARLPGLTDSKKLSEKKRLQLFEKITTTAALDYSITAVSHKLIDEQNILNATRHANDICIRNLQIKPDLVLLDGRDKQFIDLPFKTIVKGDLLVRSIAAASVLAKVTRDEIMKEYAREFPSYNFEKHKGYPTRQHRDAIRQSGVCEIHRKSFTLLA